MQVISKEHLGTELCSTKDFLLIIVQQRMFEYLSYRGLGPGDAFLLSCLAELKISKKANNQPRSDDTDGITFNIKFIRMFHDAPVIHWFLHTNALYFYRRYETLGSRGWVLVMN